MSSRHSAARPPCDLSADDDFDRDEGDLVNIAPWDGTGGLALRVDFREDRVYWSRKVWEDKDDERTDDEGCCDWLNCTVRS